MTEELGGVGGEARDGGGVWGVLEKPKALEGDLGGARRHSSTWRRTGGGVRRGSPVRTPARLGGRSADRQGTSAQAAGLLPALLFKKKK